MESSPVTLDGLVRSPDGCLLQKSFSAKSLREEILFDQLDFTGIPRTKYEPVSGTDAFEVSLLSHDDKVKLLESFKGDKKREWAFWVADMCGPYSPRRVGDRFFWYNDIGALSGSAGIVQVRDGYVWGVRAVWRS